MSPRTCITPSSNAAKAIGPCKSRSFSVLGEDTFTVAKSTYGPACFNTVAKSSARLELVLFAPRFRPTGMPMPRLLRRAAIASQPWLLKPKRLIEARSSLRRNSRGFGLPGCAIGVAAPTSIKPKPALDKGATTSAFLSKPAAKPTGLGMFKPATLVARRLDVTGPGVGARPIFRALIAKPCANSGSILSKALSPSCSITCFIRMWPFVVSSNVDRETCLQQSCREFVASIDQWQRLCPCHIGEF